MGSGKDYGFLRDATGSIDQFHNGTYISDCIIHGGNTTCKWGLQNDYQVSKDAS